MNELPSASVVIPVLNGAQTIGDTLSALMHQANPPPTLEIIVVDNGSSDHTREVARRYDVTLLDESTPGASAARNRGLRAASGEVVVSLDADTLPTRNWLNEILSPFRSPEVLLVGGRLVSFMPETPAERYIERAGFFAPENSALNPKMPFVSGGNCAVRRTAALEIGGWNEQLLRGDDNDFSFRLLRRFPTRIRYQSRAVVFHRNFQTDEALLKQARGYGCGAATLYRKYPEDLRWGWSQYISVASLLLRRTLKPPFIAAAVKLGRQTSADLEFAVYHGRWARAYWRGFLTTYYARKRSTEHSS